MDTKNIIYNIKRYLALGVFLVFSLAILIDNWLLRIMSFLWLCMVNLKHVDELIELSGFKKED